MTWTYQLQPVTEIPPDYVGFVYLITNTVTGKKYVGKKLFRFSKTSYRVEKLKNGRKRRRRVRSKIESDWQTYFGSSPELSRDVAELGPDKFTREILYYCHTKAECSYLEAREQFTRQVLESNDYYNGQIQVRVHGRHILGKLQ